MAHAHAAVLFNDLKRNGLTTSRNTDAAKNAHTIGTSQGINSRQIVCARVPLAS